MYYSCASSSSCVPLLFTFMSFLPFLFLFWDRMVWVSSLSRHISFSACCIFGWRRNLPLQTRLSFLPCPRVPWPLACLPRIRGFSATRASHRPSPCPFVILSNPSCLRALPAHLRHYLPAARPSPPPAPSLPFPFPFPSHLPPNHHPQPSPSHYRRYQNKTPSSAAMPTCNFLLPAYCSFSTLLLFLPTSLPPACLLLYPTTIYSITAALHLAYARAGACCAFLPGINRLAMENGVRRGVMGWQQTAAGKGSAAFLTPFQCGA